jgi:hypothetical protein
MTTSKQCFDLFKRSPKEFLRPFVTVDETWIHHYTAEMKEQSKQWTSPGKQRHQSAKKAKTVPLAGKVMAHRFLGFKRYNLHCLFGKGKNDHRAVF